jgi:hypothetical protein
MEFTEEARLHGRYFATRRAAMDEVVDWLSFYDARRYIRRSITSAPWRSRKTGPPLSVATRPDSLSYGIRENRGKLSLRLADAPQHPQAV